jgi:ATP-dependent DNA helicase
MNCKLIKELMTYNSANRLLITGTPLQNNISELWSLLHFLLPEVFNDLKSFEGWFDFSSVLDDSGKAEVIERRKRNLVTTMHSILKPFLLRRVKTDVEHSLPKKREYILYAPLTPEQKELYREILSGTGRQYLEGKALERLTAKSYTTTRSRSLKRRRSSDEPETPNKSQRTARDSMPASGTASARRRRGPQSYKDISDREFNSKLRKLEQGVEEDEEEIDEPNDTELEEIERANNLKLASTFATAILDALYSADNFHREGDQSKENDESHHASPSGLQLSPQLLLAMDGRELHSGRNSRVCIWQDASP